MGWVRISDDFYDHKKFADAGPLSLAVWITAMAWCNRNLTDGILSHSTAKRLVDFEGIAYTVATVGDVGGVMEDDCTPLAIWKLVETGLWHDHGHSCPSCVDPGRGKYVIHDYLEYQPSAEKIQADAEAARVRMATARAAKKAKQETSSDEHTANVQPNTDRSSTEVRSAPTPTPKVLSEPSGRAKRATQLPDDFTPTDHHHTIAADSRINIVHELAKFKDHARAKGATFKDWNAAFNNWLRKAAEYRGTVTALPVNGQPTDPAEASWMRRPMQEPQ